MENKLLVKLKSMTNLFQFRNTNNFSNYSANKFSNVCGFNQEMEGFIKLVAISNVVIKLCSYIPCSNSMAICVIK